MTSRSDDPGADRSTGGKRVRLLSGLPAQRPRWLARLRRPGLSLPQPPRISLPRITVPRITLPRITLPRPQFPARRPSRPGRMAGPESPGRWPLGRIIGTGLLGLALVLAAGIVVGAVTLSNLNTSRERVVSTLDPAALGSAQLYNALLDQETGLRGYLLSGQRAYLAPYLSGQAAQRQEAASLRGLLAGLPAAATDLSRALDRVNHWRSSYAAPALAKVAAAGKPLPGGNIGAGKAEFDAVRVPMDALQSYLSAQRGRAAARLRSDATVLDVTGIVLIVIVVLLVTAIALALRAAAIRPLARLAGDARLVAGGDFEHEVDLSGPKEVHQLAVDVNRMRERILSELSAVRARALDLERSNAELEQFAYVASHDLQEPLRKVASFCQLLQRRYLGQLDARADQYIEFAVDGAKRMQALIDDLLAFSRVGRVEREPVVVSSGSALAQARVNLAGEIRRSAATIESGPLPPVRAELSLITSLFQNLLSNAIKFRHPDRPPVIQVTATEQGDSWLFSVTDNGIGIEPEYADRIFVIFQRLHDRTAYAGTGIGLAMCRKIVEHYGGTIWLDTSFHDGARFSFTLPVTPAADGEKPDE